MEEIFGPGDLSRLPQNTLMSNDFKYDAALSFVGRDQQLALEIADRIGDRMSTFVYTERQEDFAGADGMEQHARIYGEESRVVVILHRKEWGQTDWTRFEETVIRDRAFQKGWEFLVTVALDSSEKPVWLPKTRIWVDFIRYGINGVATSIEGAVQAVGGMVRDESVTDYALRLHRQLTSKSKREAWRTTKKGVDDVNEELSSLYSKIEAYSSEVNQVTDLLRIEFNHADGNNSCSAACRDCKLVFLWRLRIRNSLHDAGLRVKLYKEKWDQFGSFRPRDIDDSIYQADIDHNEDIGWREMNGEGRFLTSTQMSEFWIKRLLEEAASNEDKDEAEESYGYQGSWG